MAKGDHAAAAVQLKAALSERPSAIEARQLLGEVLLGGGDPAGAILELQKARDLKPDSNAITLLLAKAMVQANQPARLIAALGTTQLDVPGDDAQLKGQLAWSHLALGNAIKATELAEAALRADPGSTAALLTLSRLALERGKGQEAVALIDRAVAAAPKDGHALASKADLQHRVQNDLEGAFASYRRALELEPRHVGAHTGLVSLMLAKKDLAAARAHNEQLKRLFPGNLQGQYFDAWIAFLSKDNVGALRALQPVLKAGVDNAQLLAFAGMLQTENRQLLQAERSLTKAIALDPEMNTARQWLAQVYLRLGQADKALDTVEAMAKRSGGNPNARTLTIAGQAYLRTGELGKAVANLEQALQADPDNLLTATQVALAKARSEPFEKTIASLQALAARDKANVANLVLVNLLLKAKAFDRALEAVDAIAKKLPNSPITANLRGFVYAQQGDRTRARAAFEQALKLDPKFLPAAASLAQLDVADKRPDLAKARYLALLKANPGAAGLHVALAKLQIGSAAAKDEVTEHLRQAIKLEPTSVQPRVLLVSHLMGLNEHKAALAAAQDANTAIPDNPDVLDMVGRTLVAAGDQQQAISVYGKLATLEPNSPHAHVRLAGAQLAAGKKGPAEQALRKALEIAPDFVPAQQALISLAQADKKSDRALVIAKGIIAQRPKEAVGYVLTGAVEVNRKNFAAAATIYREGLKQVQDTRLAATLYSTLLADGKQQPADDFAVWWMASKPADMVFAAHVADRALAEKRWPVAERYYRAMLAQQPENVGALNNLAWVLASQQKRGGVEHAKKATQLRPGEAGLHDTLAAALAAEGELAQAIESQKRAMGLAPNDQGLRFHLAQHYVKAGRNDDARNELQVLAKLGDKLPVHAEVQRMLASLK